MAATGTAGGFGLGLGKPEELDAQTAYNLELSRQMTVPDKIVVDDRLSQHASPAHSFIPGSTQVLKETDERPSGTGASLVDSRRMHVPDRIHYGETTATPSDVNPGAGALRHRLADLDDRAMRQSPAMAMVTPPERLTVVDQIGQVTPVARPAQPRALSPSPLAEGSEKDVSRWDTSSLDDTPAPSSELADYRPGEDDEDDRLQNRLESTEAVKALEDRISSLEERVAELERVRGAPESRDGDLALAILMFAFWLLNPLVIYAMKSAR